MTPHEFSAVVDGFVYRQKEAWKMLAWQTAHMLNVYVSKGPPITVRRLLGPAFFEGEELESEEFATKEEWEAHKADLTRVARWHSSVLRKLKAGVKEGKTVTVFKDVVTREQ